MTTIVTRAGKGTALTFAEMDANLTNLNNDKVESNTNATFSGITVTGLSGVVKATAGVLSPASSVTDYQIPLVSGTNIKTVNSTSLLGSGDVAVQATLVSGTNIKTINSTSLLGSGDLVIPTGDASTNTATSVDGEVTLFSGTGGKTLKRATGTGIAKVTSGVLGTAVSGTDLKTINGTSIIGSGDITVSGTGDVTGQASSVDSEIALFSGTTGKVIKRATNTGLLKATSGVIATAVSGTDYAPATSGTSILKGNGSGGFSNAVSNTDYQAVITATGILKGAGAGSISAGTAGTDYVAPGTTTEFTKPQRPSVTSETAPSANAVTWDLTTNEIFRVNLNANITTFNLTGTLANLAGYQYEIIIRYNGGTTITWNTNFKWTGGTAPTLTGTSGKVDILTFVVSSTDGTNFYLLNTGIKQNIG